MVWTRDERSSPSVDNCGGRFTYESSLNKADFPRRPFKLAKDPTLLAAGGRTRAFVRDATRGSRAGNKRPVICTTQWQ